MDWNEQNVKRLCDLYDQGLSGSMIARQLGVSKGTVVGKIYRLRRRGLCGARDAVFMTKSEQLRYNKERRRRQFAPPPPLPDAPPRSQCQYITGDPGFYTDISYCGEDVVAPGSPYCKAHHAKCTSLVNPFKF